MKKIFIGIISMVVFYGCSTNQSEKLDIAIHFANSEKIDIKASTYTVYFVEKEPLIINFTLSDKEKVEIAEAKEVLLNDWEPKRTDIEDSCWIAPKLYTTLTMTSKGGLNVINFDEGCDKFHPDYFPYAIRVKRFIDKITTIVKSKKEIVNAPKSDMIYF